MFSGQISSVPQMCSKIILGTLSLNGSGALTINKMKASGNPQMATESTFKEHTLSIRVFRRTILPEKGFPENKLDFYFPGLA